MTGAADLRQQSEGLAGGLPPLLAAARHLAASVLPGAHGRRRAGQGETFWQYRAVQPGDEARLIDWRRSARSDDQYIRQTEWQAAQSVLFWVDPGQSMRFASTARLPEKGDRAATLALAAAVLLVRAGERVGMASLGLPPRTGEVQLLRMATALADDGLRADYAVPDVGGVSPRSRAVFVSDFMGDVDAVEAAVTAAADRGVDGVLLQVLDPQEEAFPFDGRTVFESIGGTVRHETLQAKSLRSRYLERLAERKDRLAHLSRVTGWPYDCHHTDAAAASALLWAYQALEGAA